VRILENALDEVRRREEVYSRPALKKYGDSLSSALSPHWGGLGIARWRRY
jgi:hypothetical protein